MPYIAHITHYALRLTRYISRFTFQVLYHLDAGLLLAALLPLFIIQSLLQPGLPTLADLPIHLYRTLEYGYAWASGVIAPRWAPNLAYGYGYPLFIFAPPLPYWLGLLFYSLGFSLETAFKLLIILTILLYAIGMYLLARDLLHSFAAGLIAATAYTFAPFALREALLYGGNIPQFLAIGLFPWTLWAMARAAQRRSWAWAILAAGFYAAVLLSHLFQALVFTPVVGLFGLILARLPVAGRQKFFHHSQSTIHHSQFPALTPHPLAAIPLGLLLSAFFWLPAFSERVFTRAQTGIYLAKSPFYVRYPHWTELVAWIEPLDARAANPYAPLTLGVVTLILAGLGLAWGIRNLAPAGYERLVIRDWGSVIRDWRLVIRDWRLVIKHIITNYQSPITSYQSPPLAGLIIFFAALAAVASLMALPVSRPLWETITILQVAEFPWRMLGLADLGLAFLAGAAMLWPPPRLRWPATIACLCWQLVAVAPYLYPVLDFTRYDPVSIARQVDYERRSQSIGTTTLGEYLPQAVSRPPTTSPLVEAFLAGQYPERLDRTSLPGQATARLLAQNAVTHIYQLNSPIGFTLRFFQFDYPGWQAQLDGQPALIRPEPETGLILIEIPAGQHRLTLHFGETPGRLAALALTGLTIGGLVIAGFMRQPALRGVLSPQRAETFDKQATFSPAPLPLGFGVLLIAAAALWLKPLLRPVFTIHSPPGQALPAQHQTRINFANGIQLIGYDLDKQVVRPGERLQVTLYWQTHAAPLKTNLQPFVHLDRLDNFTTVAGATNYTPGDPTTESVLPTFHWDNARYVRDEHDLLVPPDTLPLAYAVRVGLIDPDRQGRLIALADGRGDTAQLARLNVAPGQAPPRLSQPQAVSFEVDRQTIRLIGFELDAVTPEQINFRLAWQADEQPPADYTIFAQLLDRENNLVASYDRPPLDGAYPTSTWLPGQVIIDPRFIPLTNAPPGEYRLIAGLYDPGTQQRLRTSAGADFVELTTVKIGQP